MSKNPKSKKVWLVTGYSKGLGKSLVEELIKQGYPVSGTSRNLENIIKIFPQNNLFLPIAMNLKDEEDIKKAINPLNSPRRGVSKKSFDIFV